MKAFTLYERFHWTYENLLKAGKDPEWFSKVFGKTEVYFIKIKAPAVTEAIHKGIIEMTEKLSTWATSKQ